MWESQQQTYHLGMVHTIHLWWFGGGVYNISHENRYEIHPAASMNHTMNQKSKTEMGSLSSNKKLKAFLGCKKWNQTPWAEAKRRKCCAGTSSGERGTWQRQSGLHLHRSHVWESCEKYRWKTQVPLFEGQIRCIRVYYQLIILTSINWSHRCKSNQLRKYMVTRKLLSGHTAENGSVFQYVNKSLKKNIIHPCYPGILT
jgi:hypothetical protein